MEVYFQNKLETVPDWPVNIAPGGGLADVGSDPECLAGLKAEDGDVTCVFRWVVPDSAGPSPRESTVYRTAPSQCLQSKRKCVVCRASQRTATRSMTTSKGAVGSLLTALGLRW